MTTEEALEFLRAHQPLPPTKEISEALLGQFDDVRRYFAANLDNRSIPLLLNSFGEGDGYGVYQLVESTIIAYAEDLVLPALLNALRTPLGSVRYWATQIAANYPVPELVSPLAEVLTSGNLDERIAAVTALEVIGSPDARRALQNGLGLSLQKEVKEMIRQALAN